MKCVTANPQGSKEGSPLRRAYLLLLSSQSPHKSCPDLCFNVLRVTNVPTLASCLTPSEHCLTLSYLYVLITNEAEIMTFFFHFCSRASQKTLHKVCCLCCPRRCWGIAILCCCYSRFSKGRQDPEVFSKTEMQRWIYCFKKQNWWCRKPPITGLWFALELCWPQLS